MSNALHDENNRPTMIATLDSDGSSIVRVTANSSNHGLKVDNGSSMSTVSDSPGTMANVAFGGLDPWANVNNAKVLDGIYTTSQNVNGNNQSVTNLLQASNFGFSIPLTATIIGIQVDMTCKASINSGGFLNSVGDAVASGSPPITGMGLTQSNVRVGTGKFVIGKWSTSDSTRTYGGAADMWGTSLTPADVNSSDFGVQYLGAIGADSTTTVIAYIDFIQVSVTYTSGSSGNNRGSANLDENSVAVMTALSSSGDGTLVEVFCDSNGKLLINSN